MQYEQSTRSDEIIVHKTKSGDNKLFCIFNTHAWAHETEIKTIEMMYIIKYDAVMFRFLFFFFWYMILFKRFQKK